MAVPCMYARISTYSCEIHTCIYGTYVCAMCMHVCRRSNSDPLNCTEAIPDAVHATSLARLGPKQPITNNWSRSNRSSAVYAAYALFYIDYIAVVCICIYMHDAYKDVVYVSEQTRGRHAVCSPCMLVECIADPDPSALTTPDHHKCRPPPGPPVGAQLRALT